MNAELKPLKYRAKVAISLFGVRLCEAGELCELISYNPRTGIETYRIKDREVPFRAHQSRIAFYERAQS